MANELFNILMIGMKEVAELKGDLDLAEKIEKDRLSLNADKVRSEILTINESVRENGNIDSSECIRMIESNKSLDETEGD